MEEIRYLLHLVLVLLLPLLSKSLNSDGLSLLALKSAITSDPSAVLSSWSDSDPTPCHWAGVLCSGGSVVSLTLSGRSLSGYLPSELGELLSLQRLSLSRNNFSMPIPSHLFNATSLLSLDLSHNSLCGPIPPQIAALSNLSSLDLSSNRLTGPLPVDLSNLTALRGTLNLSFNHLSGPLPPSYARLPLMLSLDLRHNNLSGEIPQLGSLLNQGPTAFSANPGLCGFPLTNPCQIHNPSYPRSLNPNNNYQKPTPKELKLQTSKRSGMALLLLLLLLALGVLGAAALSMWLARRRCLKAEEHHKVVVGEGGFYDDEGQKGKFLVMEEGFELELEDLLRASAYVVGKSRSGIVYKVVPGKGREAVAVTRLTEPDEADDVRWRLRDFEAEAEAIGRIHHPNIVRLRAYYYATHERLLVSDFISNGSLYTALHGPHSNGTPPLSWLARLNIAQGAARGLMHIHDCSPRKYVHGNLKSSKILLDEELQPYISGFGLHRLQSVCSTLPRLSVNHIGSIKRQHSSNLMLPLKGSEIPSSLSAYLAPEVKAGIKVNQKCDIYSFGVVLMEMLTGKIPDGSVEKENESKGLVGLVRKVFNDERPLSEIIDPALVNQVHVKKQVLSVFHVALSCTAMEPDLRPRMRAVCASLEAIKS